VFNRFRIALVEPEVGTSYWTDLADTPAQYALPGSRKYK
jgi:hypothetical protein